jgi:tetratricopeptide (TPR) repeat protein
VMLEVIGLGVVVGVGAIALGTLIALQVDGPSLFLAGRLDDPLGYRNATGCLFALTFWPFVIHAAARGGPRVTRAGAFALATLGLSLSFLTQSRGVLIGLAFGAAVALSLGPDRVRRAWVAILSAGLVAAFSGSLLAPYHAFHGGRGPVGVDDVATAAHAAALLAGVAFVTGMLLALLDSGLRPQGIMWARRLGRAALAVGAIGAVGAALAAIGSPIHYADRKLHEFRSVDASTTGGTTRLSSTGGQRYDLWRVAVKEFEARPLVGVGEASYQYRYYRLRRTDRNLSDPHSLALELLSETGVVGLSLFAVFLGGLAAAVVAGRRATGSRRRSATALVAAGVAFVAQAQVDWFSRIPGLMGVGLLCLVLGAALFAGPTLAPDPRGRRSLRWIGVIGLVAGAAATLALFLSNFYVRQARAERTPGAQLSAARTAARLNPLSVTPRYLEASALETLGRRAAARAELRDALRVEPQSFVTLGLLGDLEARAGNLGAARAYYARALALNPRDSGLQKLATARGAAP